MTESRRITLVNGKNGRALGARIRRLLTGTDTRLTLTENLASFMAVETREAEHAVVLGDSAIRDIRGSLQEQLREFNERFPEVPIVLLVSESYISDAIKGLETGIYQYVRLPVSDHELGLILRSILEKQSDSYPAADRDPHVPGRMIGESSAMKTVFNQLKQAAETDIPVFILGETGTGKDLAAYSIHRMSGRSSEPYLPINLGAWPSELVAGELFGHEKGAFTGAMKLHKGIFEEGDRGTVFLDEIDTLDEKMQVSLLRLLEQKRFKRLGGSRNLRSRARLIAASNENIDDLVNNGIFRSDLFYRLDVFRIQLPPLRERKRDIPLLAEAMLGEFSRQYSRRSLSFAPAALEALLKFDWPGNIRELKNVIQRAVLVASSDEIFPEDLPPRFREMEGSDSALILSPGTTLAQGEREMILHALALTGNNRSEAARRLGISRRALYNKLKKIPL